jgi:hypothetical protein
MNVYVVVVMLLIAGLQSPLIPFSDVVGNAGMLSPLQKGPTASKMGVMLGMTSTLAIAIGLPQLEFPGALATTE